MLITFIECPTGTYGINCSEMCANGYFGKFCRQECKCQPNEECDPRHGCKGILFSLFSIANKVYLIV
jgi:hypothetical protein